MPVQELSGEPEKNPGTTDAKLSNSSIDFGEGIATDGGEEFVHPSELTEFQMNLLFMLTDGPDYGLGVKRSLEEYYGKEINHGRLYPNLDTLVEMELIDRGERDKRTNDYSLTDDGWHVVRERAQFVLGKVDTTEAAPEPVGLLTDGGER